MSFSLFLDPWFLHGHFWFVPADSWMTVDGGRMVWYGAFGYVYQGTQSYALPLSFVVMAPVSGLIDHFRWLEGSPYPVRYPTAWVVAGPYALMFGIFLLHAARRLAWELGARRRLWILQALSAVVVLAPAYYWGHFEDALALTFVLHSLRYRLRADYVRAALLLSVAVSFKQWALVLIPFLVFGAPRGSRLRTALVAGALPVSFVLFFLGVDWPDASKAFFSPVNLVGHFQGHGAFYASWFGTRTSQLSRTFGLALSVPAGWWLRRARRPEHVLAAAGVIMLIRPFSEAINYGYYWSSFLVCAGLVGVAVHRMIRWQDWAWPVGATIWAWPKGNPGTINWWWLGEIILLAATTGQMLRNCGLLYGRSRKTGISVKKAHLAPIPRAMNLARTAGDTSWTQ
jgi:hypothetical protein